MWGGMLGVVVFGGRVWRWVLRARGVVEKEV